MLLAYAEAFAHYGIDVLKCRGHLTFSQDQELHLGCKIVWAVIWFIWRPW
jgi:hypothetical protein